MTWDEIDIVNGYGWDATLQTFGLALKRLWAAGVIEQEDADFVWEGVLASRMEDAEAEARTRLLSVGVDDKTSDKMALVLRVGATQVEEQKERKKAILTDTMQSVAGDTKGMLAKAIVLLVFLKLVGLL